MTEIKNTTNIATLKLAEDLSAVGDSVLDHIFEASCAGEKIFGLYESMDSEDLVQAAYDHDMDIIDVRDDFVIAISAEGDCVIVGWDNVDPFCVSVTRESLNVAKELV